MGRVRPGLRRSTGTGDGMPRPLHSSVGPWSTGSLQKVPPPWKGFGVLTPENYPPASSPLSHRKGERDSRKVLQFRSR